MPEFLWRSILGGACIGVPAYVLGLLLYSGKPIPARVLAMVGGVCGFVGGMVILSTLAPPWPPAIVISVLLGLSGAVTLRWAPARQAKLRQIVERHRGEDRGRAERR